MKRNGEFRVLLEDPEMADAYGTTPREALIGTALGVSALTTIVAYGAILASALVLVLVGPVLTLIILTALLITVGIAGPME